MAISENLLSAYRWNRQADKMKLYPMPKGAFATASEAIERARYDIAANRTRYASSRWAKPYPAVSWQQENRPRSGEKIAHVERPERAGLRLVGRVMVECGGRNGYWDSREQCGWFTDPYGDVGRDGSGLCYGLVFQLPARDGKARFVAGYEFGGTDGGPTVDFGDIWEEDCRDGYHNSDPKDYDAARDAARAADHMAQRAAEDEREYQTAWAAGNIYSDCLQELATIRKSVLSTIRDMKGACKTIAQLPESIRARLRQSIESELTERESIFAKMEKLKSGDYDSLIFYPGETERGAFNEAAGKAVL